MSKDELRKQVFQYFQAVGSGQNIVQCIKQALFLHQQFNPVLLFDIVSKGKQKITKQDWRQYLLDHNIIFSQQCLKSFLYHNNFQDATLNTFLEGLIPFNADVVRQFKQKYLDSLEITQFNPQVQFIFTELLDREFKFIQSLLTIRKDITRISNKKTIESLVKQDLVLNAQPRESKKLLEQMHGNKFQLGFQQLRLFLEYCIQREQQQADRHKKSRTKKKSLHEFYLLNIMRYLKSNKPFERIIYKGGDSSSKGKGGRGVSQPATQKRPASSQPGGAVNLTNQKIKQKFGYSPEKQYPDERYNQPMRPQSGRQNKYDQFRNQIMKQFKVENKRVVEPNYVHRNAPVQPVEQKNFREDISNSRKQRMKKGINGGPVLGIFQQIILKEQRLQKLRKQLAKNNDFNLINLFKVIDQRNQGYINSKDINEFTSTPRNQLQNLIAYYGKQRGRLRFHEFCLIFRPLSKQLNESLDSRPQHKVPNPFKKETIKLIIQVINLSSELHTFIQARRQQIRNSGMSPRLLFSFIDLDDKGYVTAQCIRKALAQNNISCDSKDLKCIMRAFRKKVDEEIVPAQFEAFLDL